MIGHSVCKWLCRLCADSSTFGADVADVDRQCRLQNPAHSQAGLPSTIAQSARNRAHLAHGRRLGRSSRAAIRECLGAMWPLCEPNEIENPTPQTHGNNHKSCANHSGRRRCNCGARRWSRKQRLHVHRTSELAERVQKNNQLRPAKTHGSTWECTLRCRRTWPGEHQNLGQTVQNRCRRWAIAGAAQLGSLQWHTT